jgi:hypothetical protein
MAKDTKGGVRDLSSLIRDDGDVILSPPCGRPRRLGGGREAGQHVMQVRFG